MRATTLAKVEHKLRPMVTSALPPSWSTAIYSWGRERFLDALKREDPDTYRPPRDLTTECWGIEFGSPIFNAAGMFKNGEPGFYNVVSRQGAGACLIGTTTSLPREGNKKDGIAKPFLPYPHSNAAQNWLGVPNDGSFVVARRVSLTPRVPGCPIGANVMPPPRITGDTRIGALVRDMRLYEDARADFIEINESCPNTSHGVSQFAGLEQRLSYVSTQFLESRKQTRRKRGVPVVVKLSNDTSLEQAGYIVDALVDLGFDGVNFGNTSTAYPERRRDIHRKDLRNFAYFTRTFGGGVSGAPLKKDSLRLCQEAVQRLSDLSPSQEFHVIRTGGIETAEDLRASQAAGVSLNQWFTGYFKGFAEHGHDVYKNLYDGLARL